ncbi:MAG: TIGR04255 family protein [Acidimicrobiales bacterium]
MLRPPDLPDFSDPPIDEVALGLQFDPIEGFTDMHVGIFWPRVRHDYPRAESHPRRDHPVEDLSPGTGLQVAVPAFQVVEPSESRGNRAWLISDDDSTLLQVQDSQFLRNWRRRDTNYPRLDEHVEKFWSSYDEFCETLMVEKLARPNVKQIELTYFNFIEPRDPSHFRMQGSASLATEGLDEKPEDVMFRLAYIDRDSGGNPLARLRIDVEPAYRAIENRPELQPGYRLTLSYRSPMNSPSRKEIETAIDRGRRVIDFSFCDLTSIESQTKWGRIQ